MIKEYSVDYENVQAKAIAKIIRNHKTKNGIHDYLEKKYGTKDQKYFKVIKPLIKDKK